MSHRRARAYKSGFEATMVYKTNESLVLELLAGDVVLTVVELVLRLPSLSWNSVFDAVDGLSRRGAIVLRRKGFQYEISSLSAPIAAESNRATYIACPQM
jgi:hypothetical protein